MKLEGRRNRNSRTRGEQSPVSSTPSRTGTEEEGPDRFGLERQGARERSIARTPSTSPGALRKDAGRASGPDREDDQVPDDAEFRASRSTKGKTSNGESVSQPAEIEPAKVGQKRKSSMRNYGRAQPSVALSKDSLDIKSDLQSVSARSTDANSVKSEASVTSTIRTSGRRTKPTTRSSGGLVPHKDASEADSLSLHSSLDTHSTSSVPDHSLASTNPRNTRESAASSDGRRISNESRRTEAVDDESFTKHSPLMTPTSSDKAVSTAFPETTILAPIPQRPTSSGHLQLEAPSESAANPEIESIAKTDGEIEDETGTEVESESIVNGTHEPQRRRLSSSSYSSDLSDLSSVSSIASANSKDSVSTTGSNTIRRLTESRNEGERQTIMGEALALIKTWQASWRALEKKVKANAKKQERNRAARQAATNVANGNGKRRR